MFFFAKKLITTVILPPTGALLLSVAGLLVLSWKPRVGRALAWTGILTVLVLSLSPVSSWLVRLVGDASPLDLRQADSAQAIVVLGGGLRRNALEYGGDTLNSLSLDRVRYAATLAHKISLPVLVTGGRVFGGRPEAEVMRDVLEKEYGVSVRWMERESRNTHENAVLSAKLLQRDGISSVLLVCHGVDVRRARREFSDAGLHIVPAPTDLPSVTVDNPLQLLPSVSALYDSHFAIYELFANVAVALHLGGA